ncbi:hypothetical protein FBU30_009971 [Linnemannia zychae]|nr:hypothetical protein FBU30_009971 [Linnemannia zychae]
MNYLPKVYNTCLTPDHYAGGIYLFDIPFSELRSYFISLTDISTPGDPISVGSLYSLPWSRDTPKYCLAYPSELAYTASPNVTVIQVGDSDYLGAGSSMGIFRANAKTDVLTERFVSSKLITLSGASGTTEILNVYTNTTGKGARWVGMRVDLTNATNHVFSTDLTIQPKGVPLVAVGTYSSSTSSTTNGYSIIFDDQGSGLAYKANGNSSSQSSFLTLGPPQNVAMNGIKLTNYSIPSSNDSIAIYSINPEKELALSQVSISGDIPPYSGTDSIAATALRNSIVVYSFNGTSPRMYSFDPQTSRWSGNGVNGGTPKQSTLIKIISIAFTIIGVVIILVIIYYFCACLTPCIACCIKFLPRRRQKKEEFPLEEKPSPLPSYQQSAPAVSVLTTTVPSPSITAPHPIVAAPAPTAFPQKYSSGAQLINSIFYMGDSGRERRSGSESKTSLVHAKCSDHHDDSDNDHESSTPSTPEPKRFPQFTPQSQTTIQPSPSSQQYSPRAPQLGTPEPPRRGPHANMPHW